MINRRTQYKAIEAERLIVYHISPYSGRHLITVVIGQENLMGPLGNKPVPS
jgi:hypothetical protein